MITRYAVASWWTGSPFARGYSGVSYAPSRIPPRVPETFPWEQFFPYDRMLDAPQEVVLADGFGMEVAALGGCGCSG
jgi:hypothetical protein